MNKILGLAAVAVLLLSACGPGDTTDDSLATDSVGQSAETTNDVGAELDAAGDAVGESVNAAGDALEETGDAIADSADNAVDATAEAGDAIADSADNALDATADAAEDAGDAVVDAADDAVDATANAAEEAGDALAEAAEDAGDEIEEETDEALADADDAAEDITAEAVDDAEETTTLGEGELGDELLEAELSQDVIDAQANAQEQLIVLQDSLAADPEFDASTELEAIRNDLEAAYTDAGPEALIVWDSVSTQFDALSSELAAGSETATDSLGILVDDLTTITDQARARSAE